MLPVSSLCRKNLCKFTQFNLSPYSQVICGSFEHNMPHLSFPVGPPTRQLRLVYVYYIQNTHEEYIIRTDFKYGNKKNYNSFYILGLVTQNDRRLLWIVFGMSDTHTHTQQAWPGRKYPCLQSLPTMVSMVTERRPMVKRKTAVGSRRHKGGYCAISAHVQSFLGTKQGDARCSKKEMSTGLIFTWIHTVFSWSLYSDGKYGTHRSMLEVILKCDQGCSRTQRSFKREVDICTWTWTKGKTHTHTQSLKWNCVTVYLIATHDIRTVILWPVQTSYDHLSRVNWLQSVCVRCEEEGQMCFGDSFYKNHSRKQGHGLKCER